MNLLHALVPNSLGPSN